MKVIPIIHVGLGNVGTEVFRLVQAQRANIQKQYGIDLRYVAVFNSKGGYFKKSGITDVPDTINSSLDVLNALKKIKSPYILIDTTASEETVPVLTHTLQSNSYVVISNKKPLSSSQQLFDALFKISNNHVLFETTVGAGLPVIQTLQTLLDSGDEIVSIEGCFSGTLGFICSAMEKGISYSNAVGQAKEKGFTEPDPRDDLSGLDVARKALILGRMIGLKLELKDIARNSFFPKELSSVSVEDFMRSIQNFDSQYETQFKKSLQQNKTLRYVATVSLSGITVGLKVVPQQSPIGSLQGPDNIIVFRTHRYTPNPMVIQGPGAGVVVTAAGVLGDICTIIRRGI